MKVLLVFLVFFLCSYYSNAQMQEEGTTTTTETIVNETTTTTTVIENKTTGDILHKDTGVVATRYEGDMDQDWGGIGSASMPSSCAFNTGRCGKGTSSTLTTFQQTIDISQFHISSGGALSWELDMYHSQNNTTGYFESKGYNDGILLWETGQVSLTNNGTPTSYSGNYDYAGALDKVFISIGGSNNYYFDNVNYTLQYNVVTSTVETWLQAVAQEQEINTAIDLMDDYQIVEQFDEVIIDMPAMPEMTESFTEITPFDEPMQLEPMFTEPPNFETEVVTMETVAEDIQEVINMPEIAIEQPEPEPVEPVEEVIVETEVTEVETQAEEPEANVEPVKEEVKEDAKEESKPEEKEVAENKPAKEEIKETKVESKTTKQQEAKEEKAKSIIESFDSNYDAVAQLTTLALVNALGADIRTYQKIPTQVQPTWYVEEEIYGNQVMYDPLGNYFGVKDNLVYERMIEEQYK